MAQKNVHLQNLGVEEPKVSLLDRLRAIFPKIRPLNLDHYVLLGFPCAIPLNIQCLGSCLSNIIKNVAVWVLLAHDGLRVRFALSRISVVLV